MRTLMNAAQRDALIRLCTRYRVQFDEADYLVHPPGGVWTPGFAEGWVGGDPNTIYVGVGPQGDVNS